MKLSMITIDCAEPRSLAEFWTKALGMEVAFDADGWFIQLRPSAEPAMPHLGLQKVPEERAGKNRVHIDFTTGDREAEIERLLGLGATRGEDHSIPGLTWTVLQDPEGNVFCVGSPH
jgi:catechol 2,3-dioxygenase-like lactoylglutathione lyase family enzyme